MLSNHFDLALKLLPTPLLVTIHKMPTTQMSTPHETIRERSMAPRLSNSTRTFAIVLIPLHLWSHSTIRMQLQLIAPNTLFHRVTNHPMSSNAILERVIITGLVPCLPMLSRITLYSSPMDPESTAAPNKKTTPLSKLSFAVHWLANSTSQESSS